jgi:fructan beta-fructosidase
MTETPSTASSAQDTRRPKIHYTPADTWINDPNGLVHLDGRYHLFFQHNPHGTDHANLSWGHAVSTDLLHWQDRPVALHHDEHEQVYSGSVVVDHGNTSGFGEPGTRPLVAVYTSHYSDRSPYAGLQAQSLAYSLDDGETWTRYAGNPVLNRESSDFRDPKVFRYGGADGYWVMVAVEAVDRMVVLYRSDDLKSWTYLSRFEAVDPVGTIWECPDLFPLAVDGDPAHTRWVLVVSIHLKEGDGGSAGIYFVGDFDGTSFTAAGIPDPTPGRQPEWEWLDHGRDHYATVSFNDAPDGRRILLGWMSNWDYARAVPTHPWRGAMALPREASLQTERHRLVLRQRVVAGLEPAETTHTLGPRDIPEGSHLLEADCGDQPYQLDATFAAGTATEFGLVLRRGAHEGTRVGYDTLNGELVLDRTASGRVDFSPHFPGIDAAPVALDHSRLQLRIYLDTTSLEVFAQDGLVSITDQIFPDPSSTGLALYSLGGTAHLISLTVTPLKAAPVTREHRPPCPGQSGDAPADDLAPARGM